MPQSRRTPVQDEVTIGAYPTHEAGGVIWAYWTEEHQPAPPDYE